MSSGIEISLFAPYLFPGTIGAGFTGFGSATVATSGSVVASGGSIATTGAFASGSTAAAGGAASTAASGAAAIAGSAVLVVGAAAAALLAAQHLQGTYDAALCAYQQRLDSEKAPIYSANKAHQDAMQAALAQARKTRVVAAESADLAFLRAGAQKLGKQVSDWPGVDPRLPGACARFLAALDQPTPDLATLFAAYEALATHIGKAAAKRREDAIRALGASPKTSALEAMAQSLQVEITALGEEVTSAPASILSEKTRAELNHSLLQVQSLAKSQPRSAEQSLQMLRGRIGREFSLGAEREAKRRFEQDAKSARLRELSGHISARAQATMAVLQNQELASSPIARVQIGALEARAVAHLERLAALLAQTLPANLAPLETLSREADQLFAETGQQLQQIAQQIYLEEQVAEVFTQLGYQVTSSADAITGNSGLVATVDSAHGVEVRLDGAGNLTSEMVAFSQSAAEIEPHAQEKVCGLMDEVFDLLKARGCGVQEKKRRHSKKGDRSLRLVKPSKKAAPSVAPATAPVQRRIGE